MTVEHVQTMARDAIVFAMANLVPEILPEVVEGHVRVMATGRSDYPNQINNVLCFPGIFRGALDVRAREIKEEMKLAAARAIADCVLLWRKWPRSFMNKSSLGMMERGSEA